MDIDPKLMKELIATFKSELDEQLQVITDGLLILEKSNSQDEAFLKVIDSIFRAAHNIKGSARGIGIMNVGDIAHRVESIFSAIKKKEIMISTDIIDLCLETVDAMRSAMESYLTNSALPFDLSALLSRLAADNTKKNETDIKTNNVDLAPVSNNHKLASSQVESTIRVSIDHLDQVSALMDEIQVNKIAIDEHYDELSKLNIKIQELTRSWKETELAIGNHFHQELDENLRKLCTLHKDNLAEVFYTIQQMYKNMRPRINELAVITNYLQTEVGMLRLVPASELLRTFPRLIRDLGHELNKNAEIVIKGEDVKMDKMVLEGLKDPINHILRNAIDHAIEPAEVRKSVGKSEVGKINLEISEEGNQILLTISDDGLGMDINQIRTIAESKHLITKAELDLMSENEILDLIFLPGFSTKDIITNVSGRGVGLDVVKENVKALKGQVSLSTQLGIGTTFYLRVPLTLASERGLMLTCGGQLFAIPTSGIERVLVVATNDIIAVSASQAIMLGNQPIPLRSLADILDLKNSDQFIQDRISVIVIKKGLQSVALVVDEIHGEKEIVVKPLQPPISNVTHVAGGTLSGNGQAILVLNSNDIIDAALHSKTNLKVNMSNETRKIKEKTQILVVDDSITTRTMEKNVLESKNYEVTLAVNGKEAWEILQKKKFSLLITDVSMPIMDGCTLTAKVKQSAELHDLPVIIVTSMDSVEDKKRGIDAGANAYIVKSEFESDSLIKIVEQLV